MKYWFLFEVHAAQVVRRAMVAGALASAFATASAEVKLAWPFADHMVLQQGQMVPVWGTASPAEPVTVEFAGQSHRTSTGADGTWRVVLDPLKPSAQGGVMTVRGNNTIALADILVGEVWLCSGQSNMEVGLDRILTSKFTSEQQQQEVVARIERDLRTPVPGLRLLRIGTNPADTLKNIWTECSPEALRKQPTGPQGFSAVGYYFGRKLTADLEVPVGMMVAAVGGTVIETWLPPEGKNYRQLVGGLAPFAVRGILWYQGESNVIAADDGASYAKKMRTLIATWRQAWDRSDLPFYYVQLPPMPYSKRRGKVLLTTEALPQFREGQAQALQLPHTGMVVTTDLADAPDLHPMNKWEVGERLARIALADAYRHPDVVSSGPVFKSLQQKSGSLILSFDNAEDGLMSRDGGPLTGFEIAGPDGKFVPGSAVIDGNHIVIDCAKLPMLAAVRFGWHEESRPNLCSRAGLPAQPFRTDNWPVQIVRADGSTDPGKPPKP